LEGIVKERTAEIVKQKEKIEVAYKNVKMLSKIGQDVTANLSIERIVEIMYENVNTLMDASILAIGFYNKDNNTLEFLGKEKRIGIVTVQSFKENVYSEYHVNILKNLAVYTSIALDNAEAYEQIAKQKQEITDSIQYAKRIQNAVLPPVDQIKKSFPEHFIFFKPRDIVSGDFYWMRQINNYAVIAAADCTGHGVPGAFMSMLGISFLNEIIRRKDITQAHDVLTELRKYVKSSLRQTGKEGEAKDGMDISLCIIDLEKRIMQFSGAYNPLFLFRNGELLVTKADKMPIGIHIKEKDNFTNHLIELQKDDVFYLFSDGYPDQFGGENNEKYKMKRFKNLLTEIHIKPMDAQKEILSETLTKWQGDIEQIDDITIIGIRI